jgi:uncharacterized protein YycO
MNFNIYTKSEFDFFLNELKVGDVLLFKGESWISKAIMWFTNSEWSHVAIYAGDGRIYESTETGVELNVLKFRINHCERILVKRYMEPLTDSDREKMIQKATELIYENYDIWQFIGLGIYFLFRKLGIRFSFLIPNSRRKMICSELVYVLYLAMGKKLSDNPKTFTPESIKSSEFFYSVCMLLED